MASSKPAVDQTKTTEVSDCPQCGSVCVGAFLLPCGHLVCRKCLRDHHGLQITCSICNLCLTLPRSKGPEDFTSLVQQLGVDPVMVQLVDQRLRGQGRQSCNMCENRDATSLCHDCKEQYCDGCAKGHRRQGLTKDHVLQTLPQALHNATSASCAVSRPRTDSASSTDSLESIRNPMDQPTSRGQSRGTKQWKQWVKQQVGLLQAALSEQDTAVTSLTDVMSRGKNLLAETQARQQLLQTYVQSLPSLAVTEHSDVDTFTVTFNIDDVSMPVQIKMDALQNRLCDVIRQPQSSSVSDVTSSVAKLQDLQSKFGAAAPCTQINRPEQTTRQQPKTAPTQPALLFTMQQLTVLFLVVLLTGIITGFELHTCVFSPASSSPQRSTDVLHASASVAQGQDEESSSPPTTTTRPPSTTTTTTRPPTTTTRPPSPTIRPPSTTTTTTTRPPTTTTRPPTTTTRPPTTTTTTTRPPTTTTTTTRPHTTTIRPPSTTTRPPTTTTTTTTPRPPTTTTRPPSTTTTPPSTTTRPLTTTTTTTRPPTTTTRPPTTTTRPPTTTTTTTTRPPTTTTQPPSTTTRPPTTTTTTTRPPTTTTRPPSTTTRPPPTTTTTTTQPPPTTTQPPIVDPMKATAQLAFAMTPACDDDKRKPGIISIISIEDGQRLVMSDLYNSKVKVVDMHHPHNVSASLTLNESPPFSLAVLPNKLIAVTTYSTKIYLLKVTDTVTVTSRITTDIEYSGIAGHSDGNLIVSCTRLDNNGVARIDILSRSGRVVRTIADSVSLTQLDTPWFLYSMDNHVYVSDYSSHAVFKINLNTGQLLDTMTHPELESLRQITADTSGHLYIACEGSHAVLVRSPSGQWRKLVEASLHSGQGFDEPYGVCVTSSGRLVVAWEGLSGSVVIAYDL